MYYIFDDISGKYLSIKKEHLDRRSRTIVTIRKVDKRGAANAYDCRKRAEDVVYELNSHGAVKMMDLMIVGDSARLATISVEDAFALAEEYGLITDKHSYKAFGAFWAALHGEE